MRRYLSLSIVFILLMIPFSVVVLAGADKCIKPLKLKELDQVLTNKVSSIASSEKEVVSDVYWGYKYKLVSQIVEKTFPTEYKNAFESYINSFKKIEAAYQSGTLSEDDIKVRNFHYYILADTIPVLLDDRLFFAVRPTSPERDLEKQASESKVWIKLSKELDSRNLKICRDEENIKKSFDNNAGEEKGYKTILENSFLKTINFDANYEIPIDVSEEFLSDPDPGKDSDKGWIPQWLKSVFTSSTKDEEKRAKEMIKDSTINQITSSSISPKTKIFLAFQREHNIKSRYMDWRNDRNFWITKTNQVSGYNLDLFVEKFEIMLDELLMTNDELKQSLEAVEIICKSQRENVPCWSTGNTIPDHSNTDNKDSYDYRTAESDN